jgi:hypothetical protein
MKVKVTDTSYVRDINSKAILNTNKKELQEYQQKKAMLTKINEINNLKQELAEVKDTMHKILSILTERK